MAALPQELIEEVLSKLPVKSLLTFKRVSRNWYSLISHDHKFHMRQSSSSSSSNNLIVYQMPIDGALFRYSDIDTCQSRKFVFPVEIAESCHLIGSANGLICLAPGFEACRSSCFVWNPCTGECKTISIPFPLSIEYSSRQNGPGYTRLFGFGYDSISHDYKILGGCDSRIRVFSLKTNSWKMLDFSVQCPLVVYGFYFNGALHWCDTAAPRITAFDLAKERIFFIEMPINWGYIWLPLFHYQGSLCTSNRDSVWVMREYGNAKSWAKFSTPLCEISSVPTAISRLGEVVYRTRDGLGFVKSDIQGRIADEDKSEMITFLGAFVYNESLISPKCFDPKRL